MKLATWNVNSLTVRLPQVLAWLQQSTDALTSAPDVLVLQETKTTDDKFPHQAFTDAGYHAEWFGQKTYNGVALLSRTPATDVVRVSATRLTATTPAGLPGMTSISVNGFTLPDAFYYRPECGSDLDQNGTVDAGDISIILLDFGPCYEPPAPLVALAPKPRIPPEDPDLKPRRAPKGDSDIQR